SAIGTKVYLTATIRGRSVTQFREISGEESGSLMVTFGLGDASVINEMTVKWPSGIVQVLQNVAVNQVLTLLESEENLAKKKSKGVI
ncbi:MAG: ASPIC/UnbV domain-containing protein, partial [Chlamydiae bacterium]|nr:ASPIC/UnbV domain-containing protein [Chlamydiota bacterium]MBI3265874.1 ASPIC/UnbV domain-containing protein [Chlamydiota bacterium]